MKTSVVYAALVAAALAATVVAQRSDTPPGRGDAPAERPPRPATDAAPPPDMGPDTKLEFFMVRPSRVRTRDTWTIGRVECRPWNTGANPEKAWVRVTAVIVRDAENAGEKAAGIELVLEDAEQNRTFLFDEAQVVELASAIDAVDAASQKLREAPKGSSRRAIWTLNGLEVGMNPRRTGGYLSPLAPDEKSVGMSPDDFLQLKRLLGDAKDVLAREGAR